jgi:glutamate carboxypeptidase
MDTRLAILLTIGLLTAPTLAEQSALSTAEQRISSYADGAREEAEALLEKVVNVNSGTMNVEGVRRVGTIFDAEFKALGFRTSWVDGAPFKRAGHLMAERNGKGPRVLLIGHLDTVFEADSPFQSSNASTRTRLADQASLT